MCTFWQQKKITFSGTYTYNIEEKEQKAAAKDKEAEKEEQNKVQDKNQAGV